MKLVDTHCHLYTEAYEGEVDKVIAEAKAAGVVAVLLPCTDVACTDALHAVADSNPSYAFPMIGLHPTCVKEDWKKSLRHLEGLLPTRFYCAIGEIGIDLHWDKTYLCAQQTAFEEQLRWSIDLDLPVSIHVREAFAETLEIIYKVGADRLRGVFHSFSGTKAQLDEALRIPNFYIGVSGVITFRNAGMSEVLKDAPIERLLSETDAPWLTPVPYRGKRNAPALMQYTVAKLADTLGKPLEETADALLVNAATLFRPLRPLLPFFLFFLFSCEVEDGLDKPTTVNEWIYQTLMQDYLWYEDMPEKATVDFGLPADQFFESLLSPEDGYQDADGNPHFFSYIESKTATRAAVDEGITYGIRYAVLPMSGGYSYLKVLYVLPGSPAAEAHLERDHWIVGMDGERNNITDPSVFQTGGGHLLQLAEFVSGKFVPTKTIALPAARLVEDMPFLKDTILYEGGYRVAYLMYNRFDPGTDDSYDNVLRQTFRRFKEEGVTECVLDLRYNGGGYLSSCQLLTSLLAPASALGKTFLILTYNGKRGQQDRAMSLLGASSVAGANLNLTRLYVLIGANTASASEAVINALIPYLGRKALILIGQQTVGKTVGSTTYGTNETYGWLLHPITFRMTNAEGNADYADGFLPDYPVSELTSPYYVLYPFGDSDDPLLSQALTHLTGN
ncbi:MAG: YchF/TatD family DNA exonuclease [Tannerellaceae bacterium]|jgi:TatD family hydrolase|nr:YchF/TatD family DNA exonuclease [Tannerellaceae bacterium]